MTQALAVDWTQVPMAEMTLPNHSQAKARWRRGVREVGSGIGIPSRRV